MSCIKIDNNEREGVREVYDIWASNKVELYPCNIMEKGKNENWVAMASVEHYPSTISTRPIIFSFLSAMNQLPTLLQRTIDDVVTVVTDRDVRVPE